VADVVIQPVEGRSLQKRFVRLPWSIYRDDPCWMPPLIHSQEELLGAVAVAVVPGDPRGA
jgi:hypothetical protein